MFENKLNWIFSWMCFVTWSQSIKLTPLHGHIITFKGDSNQFRIREDISIDFEFWLFPPDECLVFTPHW